MEIKVLGTGCANCANLQKNVVKALEEMQLEAVVSKVEDFQKIASYGIMRTPALVINEKVKIFGRVPNVEEIKKMIIEEK